MHEGTKPWDQGLSDLYCVCLLSTAVEGKRYNRAFVLDRECYDHLNSWIMLFLNPHAHAHAHWCTAQQTVPCKPFPFQVSVSISVSVGNGGTCAPQAHLDMPKNTFSNQNIHAALDNKKTPLRKLHYKFQDFLRLEQFSGTSK